MFCLRNKKTIINYTLLSGGLIHYIFRMSNKAHVLNVSEKWHVAYFGTKVETLRRILDTGDLHSTGK